MVDYEVGDSLLGASTQRVYLLREAYCAVFGAVCVLCVQRVAAVVAVDPLLFRHEFEERRVFAYGVAVSYLFYRPVTAHDSFCELFRRVGLCRFVFLDLLAVCRKHRRCLFSFVEKGAASERQYGNGCK